MIRPDGKRSYLKIGKCGAWLRTSRFIHMRFVALPKWWNIWKVDGVGPSRVNWPVFNALFLISSNLLDDEAMNMITCIAFNPYGPRNSGAILCAILAQFSARFSEPPPSVDSGTSEVAGRLR